MAGQDSTVPSGKSELTLLSYQGVFMPRKAKSFKTKRREAQMAYHQGKTDEAHKIWQQITVDRLKVKAEKAAKAAEKKAAKT